MAEGGSGGWRCVKWARRNTEHLKSGGEIDGETIKGKWQGSVSSSRLGSIKSRAIRSFLVPGVGYDSRGLNSFFLPLIYCRRLIRVFPQV
ncbi:hypothetical protein LIER_42111 [Lithospermum erythrorhizon]|uniref:Uncharacterized protein n=1 Tax=Lithospermum erythrorhizon TaxID=34254 RepID=A0AAV3RJP5_LITER